MAKQRAVSSSSARAGTRTVTVLRSLPLPPGPAPAAPEHTSPGPLAPFAQVVAGVEQRGDDRVREAAPDGPLTGRGGGGRQPAADSGWPCPLLRRAPDDTSP